MLAPSASCSTSSTGDRAEPDRDDRDAEDVRGDLSDERPGCGAVEDPGEGEQPEQSQRPEEWEDDECDVVPVSFGVVPAVLGEPEPDCEVDCECCPDGPGEDVKAGTEVGVEVGVEYGPCVGDEECDGE
jgi:hypothetical protein